MKKEVWKSGNNGGCVVSNVMPQRSSYKQKDFKSERKYYGGYLIAESIPDKEKLSLIVAAPKLLKALTECRDLLRLIGYGDSGIAKMASIAIKKATE